LLNGLERLVHQLRGVRIGLALGGGGARGMAHQGVSLAMAYPVRGQNGENAPPNSQKREPDGA
jgi:hypothetical protein